LQTVVALLTLLIAYSTAVSPLVTSFFNVRIAVVTAVTTALFLAESFMHLSRLGYLPSKAPSKSP